MNNATWTECNEDPQILRVWMAVGKAFLCEHSVDIGGVTVFNVYYTVAGLDEPGLGQIFETWTQGSGWAETVADDDANANHVPDAVETVARSLVESWEAYVALGYDVPAQGVLPIAVAMHDPNGLLPGSPGVVLPPVEAGGSTIVNVSHAASFEYLPRHELFHLFQYQYVGVLDFGTAEILLTCFTPLTGCPAASREVAELNWFQELTAEWGAHQVQGWHTSQGNPLTEELGRYARHVDAWFSVADQGLVAWSGFSVGDNQYGSFTLAEFLEEHYGGTPQNPDPADPDPSVVRRVWETLDDTTLTAVDAIESVIGAEGDTWATFLPAYAQANYTVASLDPARPYRDDDANPVWRLALASNTLTAGTTDAGELGGVDPASVGLDKARPARSIVPLTVGTPSATEIEVGPGGMTFIELIPPDVAPTTVTVNASTTSPDIDIQMMPFGAYPSLCDDPQPLTGPPSDLTGEFEIDAPCRFVTVVVTNTDPTADTATVEVTAALDQSGNQLVNPGFETGDLTGWTTFDNTAQQADVIEVVDPSLPDAPEGTYAARISSTDLLGSSGLEQTVTVTPGDSYSTSVQTHNLNGFGPTVALEVIDSNDEVLARVTQNLDADGQWHPLEASFVPTTTTVTYRLALEGYQTGESATVQFDDAILQPTGIAANLAFEQGSLAGWTMDAANPDTVFEVRSDGDPASDDPYAAHVVMSGLGFGSDQLVREVETQVAIAEVAVRVAGTPGALAILEVTDSTGIRTDSVTLTGDTTWHQLAVDVAANETVRSGSSPTGSQHSAGLTSHSTVFT